MRNETCDKCGKTCGEMFWRKIHRAANYLPHRDEVIIVWCDECFKRQTEQTVR